MALTLPVLDNCTWDGLVSEGRARIPRWAPEWTNHNSADPGITIMELFAYFCELLIYRVDRVPDSHVMAFLSLLNGPNWTPNSDLTQETAAALLALHATRRAVTPQDFETLAFAVNATRKEAEAKIARAVCVPRRDLSGLEQVNRIKDAPAHISLIVVSDRDMETGRELLHAVRQALEPARVLTTRLHVVGPRYLEFGVRATLVLKQRQDKRALLNSLLTTLKTHFDPLGGGTDGSGWPFDRNIFVSEIYELLDRSSGVDYVSRSRDPDSGDQMEELIVAGEHTDRLRRNEFEQLESLGLMPGELPGFRPDLCEIILEFPDEAEAA